MAILEVALLAKRAINTFLLAAVLLGGWDFSSGIGGSVPGNVGQVF